MSSQRMKGGLKAFSVVGGASFTVSGGDTCTSCKCGPLQGEMQVAATMVEQTIDFCPIVSSFGRSALVVEQSFPHYTSAQFGLRWLQLPKKLKEQFNNFLQ